MDQNLFDLIGLGTVVAMLLTIRYRAIRFRDRMRRKFIDVAVNEQRTLRETCWLNGKIKAIHNTIDELRDEIERIRASVNVTTPPRAGADLTSPAPAVSPLDREAHRRTFQTRDVTADNHEDDGLLEWVKSAPAARKPFVPYASYCSYSGGLFVYAKDEESTHRHYGYEADWNDVDGVARGVTLMVNRDGQVTGCIVYGVRDLVRRAEERMAASDEDDGA